MSNDDLYNAIGPEFTIRVHGLATDQLARLRQIVAGDDEDMNPAVGKPIMTDLCSFIEGFIHSRKSVKERFTVEEEYEPSVSFDDGEVRIFGSISVCYAEAHDELEDILYSEAFEAFFERETRAVLMKHLGSIAAFLRPEKIEVELGGIGES